MNETHFCSLDAEHILSIPLSTLENAEGFVASLESFRNVAGAEKASLPENLNVIRSVEPSNVSHPTEFNNPSKTEGVVKKKTAKTSQYRGVSFHSATQKWKAQIKHGGRDYMLGRHTDELTAARAFDRAVICTRRKGATLNFPREDYLDEMVQLQSMSLEELAKTFRQGLKISKESTSCYTGVRLNKRSKKYEAYLRVAGRHVHLGCYETEIAAAQAYDQAVILRHAYGVPANNGKPKLLINFPLTHYANIVQAWAAGGPALAFHALDGEQHDAAVIPASYLDMAIVEHPGGPPDNSVAFYQLHDRYVSAILKACGQTAEEDDEAHEAIGNEPMGGMTADQMTAAILNGIGPITAELEANAVYHQNMQQLFSSMLFSLASSGSEGAELARQLQQSYIDGVPIDVLMAPYLNVEALVDPQPTLTLEPEQQEAPQ